MRAFIALVRKDLQLFFGDRRAVVLSFAIPIAIASFFGSIFQGPSSDDDEPAKISVAVVDQDGSAISNAIVAAMQRDRNLAVTTPALADARKAVQRGSVAVAAIIPIGFGDAAGRAFIARGMRPQVEMLFDPTRAAELGMVRGMLTVMEAVGTEVFSGAQGRTLVDDTLRQLDASGMPAEQQAVLRNLLRSVQQLNQQADASGGGVAGALAVPYDVKESAIVAGGPNATYNGYAHSFAGMGVQFLLFTAIELGMGILLERERGLWKRFRSAPLSRLTLLGARAASGTLLTLLMLVVSFAFAIVVFRVRIAGSLLGFALVALSCSIMAATFGLLVSALGNTPAATRRVATFAVLIMVMLGGGWVPSFIFPAWLQRMTVVIPARWAVDGLDAMTWRGLGLDAAIAPTFVMLGFAVMFGVLTLARFRWEE